MISRKILSWQGLSVALKQMPQLTSSISGTNHSVREFIERSFEVVGMKVRWEGHGVSEVGFDVTTGQAVVRVDPKYFRSVWPPTAGRVRI